jgi:hypothetical protein
VCAGVLACVALALALMGGLGRGGAPARAAGQAGNPTPQTDDSVPARKVTMIGASPSEAPDETWGVGEIKENGPAVLVRYTTASGWSLGPSLPAGFKPDAPGGGNASPLAGQLTANGSGVLAGTIPGEGTAVSQVVLVRNPGNPANSFEQTPPVPAADLSSEESLFAPARAPLLAALEETPTRAGALVAPVKKSGVENGILHWDGASWTREPIVIPAASSADFRVLATGASSPSNAWLLAQLSSNYPPGAVALFRRVGEGEGAGAKWSWKPVTATGGKEEAEPLTVPLQGTSERKPFTVSGTGEPPAVQNQILTVTGEGVWIDGIRTDVQASTTMFFKAGANDSGQVSGSWCELPEGTAAGTPACEHELPEALPSGPSRSIAWATGTAPGERVITGLRGGVSLRLEGDEFKRVLALGGAPAPGDTGGTYGAAFSSSREGWLGQAGLPVHLTTEPVPSRLKPWPVSFRHTLVAIAPEPGAPVGSLSSEALAVGDQGEVARYQPGKGWLPESLFGQGGRLASPQLRAVAWPTPARAYAVGVLDKESDPQMWLWRGETGLWEPDPAAPLNFRGNLLGIAFDPSNPSRGYAVGQAGVLLRYGKSWVQDAYPAEAPCTAREVTNAQEVRACSSWTHASFTSIAFAGSQAIVAYRVLPNHSRNAYDGGLIVNEGSGWHIDQGAAGAMGPNAPWAVAGLGDGGAAFAAAGAVYERAGPGAPWQATPTPFPGGGEPGSLELFREGGALRVIAAGSAPDTYGVESEAEPPEGFPPNFVQPYPLGENAERGLIRQTAGGWSDEEHELNNVREPAGKYSFYDTVYRPDPVAAALVDETGTLGWAVGGFVDNVNRSGVLDTADVERYPADGVTPPGVGVSPVSITPPQAAEKGEKPELATFAIGGNAQCAAPCADRENAGTGPDVWLSAALARAGQIPGVRAFLYTGPRLTTGRTAGPAELPIPYKRESTRYAEILGASPVHAFAAASPTDLAGGEGELPFEQAFAAFPKPFGSGEAAPGLTPAEPAGHPSYYAFTSTGTGGTVRVIVLDDSTDVGQEQLTWLAAQLASAKSSGVPAIVVGNADLNAQIAAGDESAAAVAQVLGGGASASAYFYDSPEKNINLPLRGAESVPTFGSGTLGYVSFTAESSGAFLGASGFELGQVDANPAAREANNKAPVTVRLIPNIGELALEAKGGTLLRRSQVYQFAALARRPRAGNRAQNGSSNVETDPYIPIPSNCVGTACANRVVPEYSFSSSRPDIGDFVQPNLAAANQPAVLLGANGKPIPDPTSGLFCAYNAGTTIVTITAGGLSSSLPVTVQAGSVRRPCGTTPLKELPIQQQASAAPLPPAPAPAPAGPAPASAPPPVVPVPPAPLIAPPPARPTPALPPAPFILPAPAAAALLPFVPLPVPTPARPTPPSGTSAVTSPVEAPEREEEEEEATESVGNKAVAYHAPEHEPSPAYILGVVVLAAFAGAAVRRRPRRGRREIHVAPASISAMRAQRRLSRRDWRNR